MSYPNDRIVLFDRNMDPLPELTYEHVYSCVRSEELNGEHTLTVVTDRLLQEGWRALTIDGTGKWREWVVTEIDEEHSSGKHAIGTYQFVWSLQYDLTISYHHDMDEATSIGIGHRCTASEAAEHVLTGVAGWEVGTCDADDIVPGQPVYTPDGSIPKNSNKVNTRGRVKGNPDETGCVFIRESAWSKLSKLVKCAFYEVDAEIEVSQVGKIAARRLCLRDHLGNETALRRFDWREDLTGIKRTPSPGPYYCRVVPLGKTQEEYADDDVTKFNYPLDITEETGTHENPGPYWIQDDEAALAFRIRQPDGSYVYPTVAVEYSSEDDPELLLKAAQLDLHNHTRPGVTYEANVVQLAQAGMNAQGVSLGDEVHIVDYGFNPNEGLRIEGRVTKIVVDELAPEATTEITIGQLNETLATTIGDAVGNLSIDVERNSSVIENMSTDEYLQELLDRINTEINATGGYSYLVPGEGLITYAEEVVDPLIGLQPNGQPASAVVQIKGGSIRIANNRKAQYAGIDDWDWKSVFQSGLIATELLIATNIVTGIIEDAAHKQNSSTGNYWNLDTGELRMAAASAKVGNNTLEQYVGTVATNATDALTQQKILERLTGGYTTEGLYIQNGHLYINGSAINTGSLNASLITTGNLNANLITAGKIQSNNGRVYFDLDNNEISASKLVSASTAVEARKTIVTIDLNEDGKGGNAYGFRLYNSDNPNNYLTMRPYNSSTRNATIGSSSDIVIYNKYTVGATNAGGSFLELQDNYAVLSAGNPAASNSLSGRTGTVLLEGKSVEISAYTVKYPSNGTFTINGTFDVYGNKNRVVETDSYGVRALSAYETPTPMFGDIGEGVIDENGICYVMIDDIFSEVTEIDRKYHVFLQKYGQGDLWVEERTPRYFMVCGTPMLRFSWEVKAMQKGFANLRLEERTTEEAVNDYPYSDPTDVYDDYISEIERVYEQELEP